MKVALSSADSFVAPYIMEMLGDSLVEIPDDKLDDPASLDAADSVQYLDSHQLETG